tara:strand:- start:496 stop:1776 length:1281 start_codon:yes stop_codon:yes gene_type:complete
MTKESVTITDHRTGESYDIDLVDGALPAIALRQIKTPDDDFGLMTYDPAFTNTASCRSTITYIDGDKGILEYRGYPIDELAEKSSFLEVVHLLLHGELPGDDELGELAGIVGGNMAVEDSMKKFIDGFLPDAHPMGMLISSLACLSTYYPEAKDVTNPENRMQQIHRLLGKVPTLAAYAFRRTAGLPYPDPDPALSFAGNFLKMVFADEDGSYTQDPVLEKAMDVLFILHADHEQNCSTSAMRGVGSSYSDPYSSLAAAAAALYGPLHGGANEAVLRMLDEIGDKENIPSFIEQVKDKDSNRRLMGFGHRVYKNYDPRAKIIKDLAYEVFEVKGMNPLLEIALELEKIALEDEYFVDRKLYPNVDFYSGLIYQSMGFPTPMFPVLFAIGRTSGWLAQWNEFSDDKDQRIARPRQLYQGSPTRSYEK